MHPRVVGSGEIAIDVLHCRLKLVDGISELSQVGPRDEYVVGAESMRSRQMPRFEGSLAMAAPTVGLGPARAFRSPERPATPETPTNGG